MSFSNTYVSWIPTNNCCLDKNKIPSKSIYVNFYFEKNSSNKILKINNPFTLEFSDSFNKYCELGIEYTVTIDFNSNINNAKIQCDLLKKFAEHDLWNFNLKLVFKKTEYDKDEKNFIICKGNIISNGLVEFTITNLNNVTYTENLPNLIYTIIKRIIHNDNHHNAKIDNLIPVQEKEKFKLYNIADNLICEIKRLEYQAKMISQKKISFPDFKTIEELKCQAKGYYVYLNAFLECFSSYLKNEKKRIFKTPHFVIESLEIVYNRSKNKIESMKYKYGLILTIFAIIISMNILIKNENYNFNWVKSTNLYIIELFIIFIAIFIAYFILKGNPINIFYPIKEKMQNYLIYYEKQKSLRFINDLSIVNLFSYKFSEIKFLLINLLIINLILLVIGKINLIIVYTFLIFIIIGVDYIFFRKKVKKIFQKKP